MQPDIAIIIAAYNRPDSLRRLLDSIAHSDYTCFSNVTLIISIDYSGTNDCEKIANTFEWKFGPKKILLQDKNIGLRKHILACGDLTSLFDGVIILEDDLYVAPCFYSYCQQAYSFYLNHVDIAGIALYTYRYNEYAQCPFESISDEYDTYFMQIPCSWGQMFTKKNWLLFREFLETETSADDDIVMPQAVLNWPAKTSWKKSFYKYLVEKNMYFVYPRIALATNFGDAGIHFANEVYVWQTPLLIGIKKYHFAFLEHSKSIYDSYFELDNIAYSRITGDFTSVSFDLNGTKALRHVTTRFLISSKICHKPIKTYPLLLYPYEMNILNDLKNVHKNDFVFHLGETSDFSESLFFNRLQVDVRRTLPLKDFLMQIFGEQKKARPLRRSYLFVKAFLRGYKSKK